MLHHLVPPRGAVPMPGISVPVPKPSPCRNQDLVSSSHNKGLSPAINISVQMLSHLCESPSLKASDGARLWQTELVLHVLALHPTCCRHQPQNGALLAQTDTSVLQKLGKWANSHITTQQCLHFSSPLSSNIS